MAPLGLYLHVPFCASICRYCDFARGLYEPGLVARYLRALEAEIRAAPARSGLPARPPADTVYVGGGTPSLLDPRGVATILRACRETFAIAPGAEITLEANPDSVSEDRLGAVREAGVTRLSLGVQSFRDDELRRLGRRHDAAGARRAVAAARAAGFDNLGLDLMMGLPAQPRADWMASVEESAALAPEHLSLYILELYPSAPLVADMAAAGWAMPPDDEVADMYEGAMARLEGAGYRQYEISNVARPGCESRHNLKYWRDGEWLGFGPGAHSTMGGARWRNDADTAAWARRVETGTSPEIERLVLTPDIRWKEALITALRLADGVALAAFRETYGVDLEARAGGRLETMSAAGLVVLDSGRLRLTRPGMLVASEVLRVFMEAAVR